MGLTELRKRRIDCSGMAFRSSAAELFHGLGIRQLFAAAVTSFGDESTCSERVRQRSPAFQLTVALFICRTSSCFLRMNTKELDASKCENALDLRVFYGSQCLI